jgi:hypothetical protein
MTSLTLTAWFYKDVFTFSVNDGTLLSFYFDVSSILVVGIFTRYFVLKLHCLLVHFCTQVVIVYAIVR